MNSIKTSHVYARIEYAQTVSVGQRIFPNVSRNGKKLGNGVVLTRKDVGTAGPFSFSNKHQSFVSHNLLILIKKKKGNEKKKKNTLCLTTVLFRISTLLLPTKSK